MLTAELKVNGCLIGHLYIVNQGAPGRKPGTTLYEVQYHRVDPCWTECIFLDHDREDGAEALVAQALKLMSKYIND